MRMGAVLAAVIVAVVSSWTSAASADEEEKVEKKEKATEWYGWQTLLVDAAAASFMIGAVASAPDHLETTEAMGALLLPARLLKDGPDSTPAIDASVAVYTLGPAFVHALHGRGVQAVASPAIRALAPTIGTVAGLGYGVVAALVVSAADNRNNREAAGDVFVGCIASGFVVGFVAPVVIDAVAFGHEPVEAKPIPKKDDAAKVKWNPRVGWTKDGPNVGLSGTF
jgi:hypothetical protein